MDALRPVFGGRRVDLVTRRELTPPLMGWVWVTVEGSEAEAG
jgi:hypothetical protein